LELKAKQRGKETEPSGERNSTKVVTNINWGLATMGVVVNGVRTMSKRSVGDVILVTGFETGVFHRASNEDGDDVFLRHASFANRAS